MEKDIHTVIRDTFEPGGLTNVRPLGKSNLSWMDFGCGVSTTKAERYRASGGSEANHTIRSIEVQLMVNADDSAHVGGEYQDGLGEGSAGSDHHREGQGIDRR
jgi:hypothetical protein